MTVNYAAEGRIREVCALAGMRETAMEDVVTRFRDNQFTEAALPEKIEEWRATPDHIFSATRGPTRKAKHSPHSARAAH